MLDYAKSICVIYSNDHCNGCPLYCVCKQKITLSREDVEQWIIEMDGKAKEILGR